MKQHELDEITRMAKILADSKVGKHTDKQLAHYETYKGKKFSDSHKAKLREANLGRQYSEATRSKMSKNRTGKKMNVSEEGKRKRTDKTSTPINQYNLQGEFIKTFNSQMDAQRELDIERAKINKLSLKPGALARGLDSQQKSNGYYWRYAPYKNNIKDEIDALTGNKMKGQTRARAICQLDLNGNLIAEHPSIKKASETLGISNANINQCCKKQQNGKNATYKGYIWRYL